MKKMSNVCSNLACHPNLRAVHMSTFNIKTKKNSQQLEDRTKRRINGGIRLKKDKEDPGECITGRKVEQSQIPRNNTDLGIKLQVTQMGNNIENETCGLPRVECT